MSDLFNHLVKLGEKNPELRDNISPVLSFLKKAEDNTAWIKLETRYDKYGKPEKGDKIHVYPVGYSEKQDSVIKEVKKVGRHWTSTGTTNHNGGWFVKIDAGDINLHEKRSKRTNSRYTVKTRYKKKRKSEKARANLSISKAKEIAENIKQRVGKELEYLEPKQDILGGNSSWGGVEMKIGDHVIKIKEYFREEQDTDILVDGEEASSPQKALKKIKVDKESFNLRRR